MKLLIIADSHSNIDALRAIWEKENNCDYIIFAGDMVDCGFNPEETVEWFMEHSDILLAVRGNHDDLILSKRNEPKKTVFENHQDYTLSKLSEEHLCFLASLPRERTFNLDGKDFYVCHMIYDFPEDVYYVEKQIVQCAQVQ